MHLSKLHETDLFGRFFLKVPGDAQFDTYYRSINALRPLLKSEDWNESVTGYYINVAGNMDAVRLSYFTADSARVQRCVKSFCSQNNIIESQSPELPHQTKISEGYGGEELRFRRYLYVYTLIGIDIIQADLLNARRLMATFRWQIMPSRQPYRPHFEKTFKSQSAAYNSLSQEQREQFWLDLSNWPNPLQVDWAHMMVNMVLPGDWIQNWNYFLLQKPAMSINEINKIVSNLGFHILDGWHPL